MPAIYLLSYTNMHYMAGNGVVEKKMAPAKSRIIGA